MIEAFDRAFRKAAADAQALLSRRWSDATVAVADASPADAIISEARRVRARIIVVGWRGHGPIGRLLLGSVSRAVIRKAPCSVLVVNRRSEHARRVVIGMDGSPNAWRAVDLIAELAVPPGNSVTLVTALYPMLLPSIAPLPMTVRGRIARELAALKADSAVTARRELDKAAATLRNAGWQVQTVLRSGAPLAMLMSAVRAVQADLLVVGARGVDMKERLLLGSVAEGALNRCPVPVLTVR